LLVRFEQADILAKRALDNFPTVVAPKRLLQPRSPFLRIHGDPSAMNPLTFTHY
jgi:hypothetical protein